MKSLTFILLTANWTYWLTQQRREQLWYAVTINQIQNNLGLSHHLRLNCSSLLSLQSFAGFTIISMCIIFQASFSYCQKEKWLYSSRHFLALYSLNVFTRLVPQNFVYLVIICNILFLDFKDTNRIGNSHHCLKFKIVALFVARCP